jgi:hypothetical protein
MFDRLEPVGVCLSYCCTERLIESIRTDFDSSLVDAVRNGKRIRLVGDNVNMTVGVRDERADRHGKQLNYFGSAALVHDFNFPAASRTTPQRDYRTVTSADLLPSPDDNNHLIDDYVHMAMHVSLKHIAYFSYLKELLPQYLLDENSDKLKQKTGVIPLSVLAKNEQHYGDVVDILRYYECTINDVYKKAGQEIAGAKIHIGGDQMTRQNFSGAKRLLIGAPTPADRFEHLSPITAEFFHAAMKFLSVAFKRLFDSNSNREMGTMKAEQLRIQRTTVSSDVPNAYTPDKEFFVSFVNSYIVEAVLQYFQMEDTLSSPPTKLVPLNADKRLEWTKQHFQAIIKESVGTFAHRSKKSKGFI